MPQLHQQSDSLLINIPLSHFTQSSVHSYHPLSFNPSWLFQSSSLISSQIYIAIFLSLSIKKFLFSIIKYCSISFKHFFKKYRISPFSFLSSHCQQNFSIHFPFLLSALSLIHSFSLIQSPISSDSNQSPFLSPSLMQSSIFFVSDSNQSLFLSPSLIQSPIFFVSDSNQSPFLSPSLTFISTMMSQMGLSSSMLCLEVTEYTRMNACPFPMLSRCMAGNWWDPVVSVIWSVHMFLLQVITYKIKLMLLLVQPKAK